MDDVIKRLILSIFIETEHIELVPAYGGAKKDGSLTSGLDDVKANRARGTLRKPIIIYGFDSEIRIRQHRSGSILDAPGVFYLRLPALLSDIKVIIEKTTNARITEDWAIDEKSFRDYATLEIRAFKHRVDNVCTAMEMNANRTRREMERSPGLIPKALSEFKPSNVQNLLNEYKEIEALCRRLGIPGADRVMGIMNEVLAETAQIAYKTTVPSAALDSAFHCVKLGRAISSILEQAKEL